MCFLLTSLLRSTCVGLCCGPQAGQVLRDAEDDEYEMGSEAEEEEEEVTLDGEDGVPVSPSCTGRNLYFCRSGGTCCVLGRR